MHDRSNKQQMHALPDWVSWLAQDADGTWWGFEVEPLQSHNGWYENEVGRCMKITLESPNLNWSKTLRKVKRHRA